MKVYFHSTVYKLKVNQFSNVSKHNFSRHVFLRTAVNIQEK